MTKPILFSYWRSSCSWRVRAALAFKGIDYEYKAVNLLNKEQLSDEYRSHNPSGVVPAWCENGRSIAESLAILEYLEEMHPEPPLLPADKFDRAQIRSICNQIASGIQPIQNLRVLQHLGKDKSQEWGKYWITRGFQALEKKLEKTAGKYSFGDSLTMADLCLVPQVYNAKRFNVGMSEFPIIERIDKALSGEKCIQQSHPNKMPDCPEDQRS